MYYLDLFASFALFYFTKYITFKNDTYIKNKQPQIPHYDIWRDNIGTPLINYYYLDDIAVFLWVVLNLYSINTLNDLQNMIRLTNLLYLIRVICVSTTYGYISPRRHARNIIDRFDFNYTCTDLIISGHALLTTVSFISVYNNNTIPIILSIPLYICTLLCILATGNHYTVDVILAVILTYLVYKSAIYI